MKIGSYIKRGMAIFRNRNGPASRCCNVFKCNASLPDCPDKLISKGVLVVIFAIMLIILLFIFQPIQSEFNVLVINAKDPPIHTVGSHFLSVALDSSLIAESFHGFNMSDIRVLKTMKYLGGGYLRIGGTMADGLIFDPYGKRKFKSRLQNVLDGDECAYEEKFCTVLDRPNFTMSGDEWTQLNRFALYTNFTILFDLNCLIRNDDGSWNYSNAEELIKFSNDRNFDIIWELGNEPDAFRHIFNYEVNATQLAKDFKVLRGILRKYPKYENALIVGPDVTKPRLHNKKIAGYLYEFLNSIDEDTIDAITWHQYYFNGKEAFLYFFINPDVFNLLQKEITIVKNAAIASNHRNTPIWLGETSSAYGGGAPSFSDRFISTFIWLDKLGLAAKNGIDVVIRQTFFKGHYALINELYEPNSDWWISVLYKLLVGKKVVECLLAAPPEVRIYCHCNGPNSYAKQPAITVFGMNMKNSDAVVRIQEAEAKISYAYTIRGFILQTRVSVLSRYMFLNDELLSLANLDLPPIIPMNLTANSITMPPFSIGFWIISSSNFLVCY